MRKTVVTFGVIAGLILSGLMVLSTGVADRVGFGSAEVLGYTSMVAAFLMVFFGVKSYRDRVGQGEISFGKAFGMSVAMVGLASIFYVATWNVLYTAVWPDFGKQYAEHVIEQARADGATDAELARKRHEMAVFQQRYQNPVFRSAMTFLEPLPVGLVMSLFTAGVLRRRKAALVGQAISSTIQGA